MLTFRSFLVNLILSFLVLFGFQLRFAKSSENPLIIENLELLRRGKQISVSLITNNKPVYEITESLSSKTLVIKFKEARVSFFDGGMERLFSDHQIAGIRFLEVGSDIWAQFKLIEKNLSYSVSSLKNSNGIRIDFRPIFEVEPILDPPVDAIYNLDEVKFDSSSANFTRIIFNFSRRNLLSPKNSIPEDKNPPRIFLLEDKLKNHLRIRITNTLPQEKIERINFSGSRLDMVDLSPAVNQTFINLKLKMSSFRVEKKFISNPIKWELEIHGSPYISKKDTPTEDLKKLTPKELSVLEEKKKAISRRSLKIRPLFQQGENYLRQKKYNEAVEFFKKAYALGKENAKGEFKDPLHPLAAKSLFRIGDTIYTMIERRIGNNYHEAIDAYKAAIRITKDAEKISLEKGVDLEQASLLPHANFRIGRAYQKMNFHHEAEVYYNTLQDTFPNSKQAIEVNFWKGVSKIDQRQWENGITNFQQYLRKSSKPKYFSVTHYKMAQAYYHLKRYITAKEFFDIARDSDKEYVKDDPSLLFHMGETYYENADYVTAREIFRILLQKYPKADFSKLVALRLGDFFRDEGKEEEAIEAYKNAISSYTREIALIGKLRIANIKSKRPHTGEFKEAIKIYNEIARLYPETPQAEEAMLRHGLTLTLYGFYTEAIKSLEKFMEKYPRNVYVIRNVIQENIDENIKGLIDHFFRLNDHFSLVGTYNDYKSKYFFNFRFGITLFQTAVAHRKLGFFDESIDLLNFLENKSTGTIKELAQLEKAQLFLEKEDLTEARNTIVKFLKDYPDGDYDPESRKLLALIYRKQKFFDRSILVYSQAIEKYEKTKVLARLEVLPELYHDLAKLHEEKGNFVEAGNAYEKTISSFNYPLNNNETPEYIINSNFLIGEMHYKAQNFEKALSAYNRVISLYSENKKKDIIENVFWSHFHVGVIYKKQEEFNKALKKFKELLEDNGEEIPQLGKKLASENYREISNRLDYSGYTKD